VQPPTSEGRGLRCERCGGTFPIQTLAAAVRCPYCGAATDLSRQTVVQAKAYRADVFAEMRRADAERRAAAEAWQAHRTMEGAQKSSVQTLWIFIAMNALPALFVPCIFFFQLASGPRPQLEAMAGPALGVAGTLCPMVLLLAIPGYGLFANRREERRAARARAAAGGAAEVACPHCGAPNRLAPGQAVQTCGHCRGALVPSQTVMVRGLDAVREARRRASLERFRAERRRDASGSASRQVSFYLVFWVLQVAPVPVIALAFLLYLAVTRLDWTALLLLAVAVFLPVGGATAYFTHRWLRIRQRRRELRAALEDLAVQFHGEAAFARSAMLDWLDAHWAGPYDVAFLAAGKDFGAVRLDAWGFPTLVAVNPRAGFGGGRRYVRLLLAAWIPGLSDGQPAPPLDARAEATLRWLRASGFDVERTPAGLVATARPHVLERIAKEPDEVHPLALVVGHLTRLAQEIDAAPVPSFPSAAAA
jgi:hypothetical protein